MQITINGEKQLFNDNYSILNIIEELKIDSRKVAIERNLEIVPKSQYDRVTISEGDNIEIVHFIGGG